MDNNQNNTGSQQNPETEKPRTITTTVTCSKCGNVETVTIEIPEDDKTPKVTWTG